MSKPTTYNYGVKLFTKWQYKGEYHTRQTGGVHIGIWETIGFHDLQSKDKSKVTVKRVMTRDNEYPVGKELIFPLVIFDCLFKEVMIIDADNYTKEMLRHKKLKRITNG